MPVYNASELINQAIDSLLAQDMSDFELIISDNASTDNTYEICQNYANNDKRIKLYRNDTNIGALGNFDRVAQLAQGQFFMWACHDDLWEPTFISKCLNAIQDTKAVLAYPQTLAFWSDGQNRKILHNKIGSTIDIQSPSKRLARVYKGSDLWALFFGLMRTSVAKKLLPMPRVHSNDSAFVALLAIEGGFVYVPEILFKYRDKQQSYQRYNSKQWLGEQEIQKQKKYRSFWPTAIYICKRIWKTDISMSEKFKATAETIRWCITEQETIKPQTRQKIKKIAKHVLNHNNNNKNKDNQEHRKI